LQQPQTLPGIDLLGAVMLVVEIGSDMSAYGSTASVLTLDFLKAQAARGKRSDFDHYLSVVPDVPAQTGDERV